MTTALTLDLANETRRRILQDPGFFYREVLGVSPYEKQLDIAKAVLRYPQVAVVGPNAGGKDWNTAVIILLWLQLWDKAKVIIYGPTYRQVADILWNEVQSRYYGAKVSLGGQMNKEPNSGYQIDPDRFAIGFSAEKPILPRASTVLI